MMVVNTHGDRGIIGASGMGLLGHDHVRGLGIFSGPERRSKENVGAEVKSWPLLERATHMRCGYGVGSCPTEY